MGNSDSRLSFNESLNTFSTATDVSEASLLALCSLPVRVEDVFEVISPEFVRTLRREDPAKLLALLKHVIDSVYELYEKSLSFPLLDETDLARLHTGVRLLTRIVPFVNDDGSNDLFTDCLWNNIVPVSIDDADPDSVGYRLLGALMRLGFIRGYSIPSSSPLPSTLVDPNRVDENLVWGKGGGIGGVPLVRPNSVSITSQMLSNRLEILRLFTLVLSRPLFMTLSEFKKEGSPIFNKLITSGDFIHTANLFLSLLLTVLQFQSSHYAIPIITNSLSEDTSPEESLVTLSLVLLNVLLDPRDDTVAHAFREILKSGISEKEELDLIVSQFRDILKSVYSSNSSFSFSLNSKLSNWNPFILFLFNLVSVNPRIIDSFAADSVAGPNLVLAILFLLKSNLGESGNAGLVHTCAFLLLALSGNREFVLNVMTKKYSNEIGEFGVGTFFDFFVCLLVKLVKQQKLTESLMELLLTVVCNMSPFVGINQLASVSLLGLLDKMTKPPNPWMLAMKGRQVSVQFALETINNCIYYQYENSSSLVYELLLPNGRRICGNLVPELGDLLACTGKLVEFLAPRIEEECRLNEGEWDAGHVSQLVKRISIVGILPVPSPITVRHFQPSEQTRVWFTSYLWGTVFSVLQVFPVIDWKRVRMVTLSKTDSKDDKIDDSPVVDGLVSREGTVDK